MLVLTRKLQQQVKIGDQITVTILRVKGNTVRLGIEAPRAVRVARGELPKNVAASEELSGSETSITLAIEADALDPTAIEAADHGSHDDCGVDCGHELQTAHSPRLPQLRAFDRYGSAPLKSLVAHAVLAK